MQRNSLWFLALAAIAVAVGLAAWFRGGDGAPPPPPPAGATGGPATAMAPDESPGSDPAADFADLPADAPQVRLTVTSRERYVAPPSPPALAVRADGVPLPCAITAGAGAGYDASPTARGVALVAIALDGDPAVAGHRVLRQLSIGEPGSAPARVGVPLVLRGRVVDAAQQPVAGAWVWFGEVSAAGERRIAITDDDGRFDSDAPAGTGVPFVVGADGFATAARFVVVEGVPGELTAVLSPGTQLDVQLATSAVAMADARVFVVPLGAVSTELAHWPFFLQALDDGYPLDANGAAAVTGLPQRGELGVVVRHPLAPLAAPVPVRLDAPRGRVVVPLRLVADAVRGAVVDERGEPLADVAVWSRAPARALASAASSRLLPPHLDLRDTCFVRTAADGRFALGAIAGGEALVSLRAPDRAGRDLPAASVGTEGLLLPAWRGGLVELVVAPPVADRPWSCAADLGGGVQTALAANAPCRLALPHAGRFDVDVEVLVGGERRAHAARRDLIATGPVDVTPPAPE